MSALTLLEGPNKVPYRNLFTSHFPLFTSTKNSVIPAANHSSDPSAHVHWDLHPHWSSLFSIPRNPGSIVLSCTEKPGR